MNKIIDLGIIEQRDEIVDDEKIVTVKNDNQVALLENNNSQIESAMLELGIETNLTVDELFDIAVSSSNKAAYHAVRAGIAFLAAQNGLQLQGEKMKLRQSQSTFKSWIDSYGLSERRVYESIGIAKTYLAIPSEQRKKYIALGQYKATKLASVDPEVIKEIAEQEPDKLDEFALMSRAELKTEIDKLKKRVTCQDAELENRDTEIAHLSSKKRITTWHPRTEDVRAECLALKAESELGLNSLYKLFENVIENDNALPEQEFRINQIIVTVQTLNAVMTDINEKISAFIPKEDWPDGIKGENFMSPAEAQKWLQDYRLIESRHDARTAAREIAREDERHRGRGRPKKVAR